MDTQRQIAKHPAVRGLPGRAGKLIFLFGLILAIPGGLSAEEWKPFLSPANPGSFPWLRDFSAVYEFGWSGVVAGEARAELKREGRNYRFKVKGGTTGAARRLWRLDARATTAGDIRTLLPRTFLQVETYRNYQLITRAEFSSFAVRRQRYRVPGPETPTWKGFEYPALRDLVASMLFVRSQPLEKGDRVGFLSFPGDAPFLVEMTCEGREDIVWRGSKRPAIRLSQKIRRIATRGPERGQLQAHGKFRSGTVWLSDDADRLPLRAEVRLFIGYVYGELREVNWDP